MISLKEEDVYELIENRVSNYIFHQIMQTHIINEIDFQFKIIYFLESKIDLYSDLNWNIFNCYYLKKPKMYPDIIIFHDKRPVICIELKFFRFKPPGNKVVIEDLNKLHIYFNDYPSLKKGYSINVFNLLSDNFNKFERIMRNKIKDDRISILNINLREIVGYKKIRKNYYSNTKSLYSHFSRWEE